jgi:hypothetical protein
MLYVMYENDLTSYTNLQIIYSMWADRIIARKVPLVLKATDPKNLFSERTFFCVVGAVAL